MSSSALVHLSGMNKKFGIEALRGIGGGIVSEESRLNLEKGEYLLHTKQYTEAKTYFRKAMEDPNNLDADIRMASLLSTRLAIPRLEDARLRGRKILQAILGENCFNNGSEIVGNFYAIVETRPYMRLLQALLETYTEAQKYDEAARTVIESLRLCPNDNGGCRYYAGSILIRTGRYADALYFCQQWLTEKAVCSGEAPPRGGTDFKSPHRNTMAVKKEKKYQYVVGGLLYSAALASFKHFGDCEQSRQYLKLAAIAHPHVLVKILARIKQPDKFTSSLVLRRKNGPEDAHDYLLYTQDLWMEPSVWKWANANPDVKSVLMKTCGRSSCGNVETRPAEYKRCSACHLVSYCGPTCQQEDWKTHKLVCLAYKQEREADRALLLGKPHPHPNCQGRTLPHEEF